MNFKRNLFVISALIGTVLSLSSCNKKNAFALYSFLDMPTDAHQDEIINDGAAIKYKEYSSYVAQGINGAKHELGSFYNVETKYSGKSIINAEGEKKILVIPVQFSDFTIGDLGIDGKTYVDNLNKAFFGAAKNNRYVSVSEYYNRSSYGKFRLSGKVSEKFYLFPKSKYEIMLENTSRDYVSSCYDKVIEWYQKEVGPIDEFKLGNDPNNRDIPLYLVYTIPIEANKENVPLLWHYTFPNTLLSWSSYSCMDTLNGNPDSHTLIHETAHLLGLEDYYPNEDEEATTSVLPQPTGKIDMMDCNVGDHTGLSKMMLNWARPYHVKSGCEIKLNALVNSGDLILINDHWNGSVFDEYYLLEFYSPTGLNNLDANVGNNQAKLPTMPGVKIYHVDARLGYFQGTRSDPKFEKYCDDGGFDPNSSTVKVKLVHDNTFNLSASEEQSNFRNFLYELVPNNLDHTMTTCASNVNLFHKGDSFSKFVFNKPNDTRCRISITGLTYRDATIKIEKDQ